MLQLQFYYRVPTNQKTFNIREDSGGGNGRDNKALDQRPHNKFFFLIDSAATFLFRFLLVEGREKNEVAVNNQKRSKHTKHTNEDLPFQIHSPLMSQIHVIKAGNLCI